jgi:predicted molibdopterin-dependent oxidoreductase YjgC
VIRFTIDGAPASAPDGELLVAAAARNGVAIPTLCHDPALEPYGGCRMCLVGVAGAPRPLAACATRVREGMAVSTEAVGGLRRTLAEMLLSEHLEPNPGGRPNELTALAADLGAEQSYVLPGAGRIAYEDRSTLLGYDPDACILCGRCVRYAQEVMQCAALGIEGRGPHAHVTPTHGLSWLDTDCELCGGCLATCPTGALYEKPLQGFPAGHEEGLHQVRTTCTYCGVGCQLDLNVDLSEARLVKITSRAEYLPNEGNLCVKGRFAHAFVHHGDRLTRPMVRGEDGELHRASWETALQAAAAGLEGVRRRHGAQALAVLASARLTNEENYLIQKLARLGMGTNSVHSCEST